MSYIFLPPDVKKDAYPLICDDAYHTLDVGYAVMPMAGMAFADIYLNIDSGYNTTTKATTVTTTCGLCKSVTTEERLITQPGRLRIRMVREPLGSLPEDPTYYFDLTLENPAISRLDTRAMFEKTEAGRPLHWEYRVTNATNVTLLTRYIKYSINVGEVDV